jgi:hypothetical protein
MFKILLLSFASALFVGCAGIYAAMIGANDIIVFDQPPEQAYDVVSVAFGQDEYIDDAIRELKIKAKRAKADAIILKRNEPTHNSPQANGDNNQIVQVNQSQNVYTAVGNSKIIVEATIIRFRRENTNQ